MSPSTNAGRTRVAVRRVRQHHQCEQAEKDKLDLGLDHAVAVAAEEPGRDSRQQQDQPQGHDEEGREPEVRLEEDRRERSAAKGYSIVTKP